MLPLNEDIIRMIKVFSDVLKLGITAYNKKNSDLVAPRPPPRQTEEPPERPDQDKDK